jgi:hypothetical protein
MRNRPCGHSERSKATTMPFAVVLVAAALAFAPLSTAPAAVQRPPTSPLQPKLDTAHKIDSTLAAVERVEQRSGEGAALREAHARDQRTRNQKVWVDIEATAADAADARLAAIRQGGGHPNGVWEPRRSVPPPGGAHKCGQ